jgi:integrase
LATIYKRVITDPKTKKPVKSKVWWISYQENGRQVRRSLGVTQKELAEIKKADIEKNIERGSVGLPLLNVETHRVIDEFVAGVINNKSPTWRKRLHQLFKPFVRFLEAHKLENLTKITAGDIEDHLNARSHVIAAKTRNEEHRVIKQFFKYAVDRDYLAKNPAATVERRHAEKPAVEILTSRELSLIFKHAPDELLSFLKLLLYTGLRDGEARFLRWQDVDLTLGKAHVSVRSTAWHRTKTRQDRIVPLSKEAIAVLQALEAERDPAVQWVFPNRKGKPKVHLRNTWIDLLARIQEREGVTIDKGRHMTGFHLFRHTFATNALASGVDIRTVQDWLGHANITQTQRYLNLLPEHKLQQIGKLNIQIDDIDE